MGHGTSLQSIQRPTARPPRITIKSRSGFRVAPGDTLRITPTGCYVRIRRTTNVVIVKARPRMCHWFNPTRLSVALRHVSDVLARDLSACLLRDRYPIGDLFCFVLRLFFSFHISSFYPFLFILFSVEHGSRVPFRRERVFAFYSPRVHLLACHVRAAKFVANR